MYRRLQITSLFSLALSFLTLFFIPMLSFPFSRLTCFLLSVLIRLQFSIFFFFYFGYRVVISFVDRCGSPRNNFSSTLNIFYLILSYSFARSHSLIPSLSLFLSLALFYLHICFFLSLSLSLSRFFVRIFFFKLVSLDST